MNNTNSPLPTDTREMTPDEKIAYIEQRGYQLKRMRETQERWASFDPSMQSLGNAEWAADMMRAAKAYGMYDFARICVNIFNGELQAKIIALDAELKMMIK